ncbi:MarR family winged helix-turn-helix transcriptional regulator [Desulfotignum balticum]|uniref:MarR family winged helix-turn-helix transcriptional regulator n=1 Tax=Desulfotignum balticum TaxID=115781 RepID=UPI00046274E0|nr:MarR family transcriptional regulator [Desulfotignum balticum]
MAPPNYRNDLTLDEKVLMAIVRAAENFKRTHSAVFKPFGLSFPQYNILRVLESSYKGQNKISVVGKIMLVPNANMTGLAKRLEQKGFITRQPDPGDERVTLLTITEKGRVTLRQIKKEKDSAISAILKDFNSADKTKLLEQIKKIITATSEMNPLPDKPQTT